MNSKPYHYEIPGAAPSDYFGTIEECVDACKAECADLGVDYDRRDVMLFMTDADGVWEVTEEGELAG